MAIIDDVNNIYNAVLLREPSDAETVALVAEIETNGVAAAIESIATSEEAQADVWPFVRVYQSIFGRVPDADGLNFWVDALRGGLTLQTIISGDESLGIDGFANSPEFVATYGADVDTNSEAFITALYQNLLGRDPEPEGLEFYTNLPEGTPVGDVVAAFTESEELSGSINGQIEVFLEKAGAGTQDYEGSVYDLNDDGVINELDDPDNFPHPLQEVADAVASLDAAEMTLADALEAAALADNANESDGDAVLEGAALQTFVDSYDAAAADAELANAQGALFTAQTGALTAQQDLASARASTSDAQLDQNLADAREAIEGTTDEALLIARDEAAAELEADVAQDGSSIALLTNLRTAIGEYAAAGGDLMIDVDGGTTTVADVLADLNADLNADPIVEADIDALIDAVGGFDISFTDGTAEEEALEAAWDEVTQRDELVTEAADTQTALTTGGAEATAVVNAEADIEAREGLIEAEADAQEALAEAEAYFEQVSDLVAAIDAAEADVAAATEAFDALGVVAPETVESGASEAATAGDDIFLVGEGGGDITDFNALGDDLLFVGEGFTLVDLESGVSLASTAQGDATALEIFVQQNGANVELFIEGNAFEGSSTTGFEGETITLAGVEAEDIQLDALGFISIMDSETVA